MGVFRITSLQRCDTPAIPCNGRSKNSGSSMEWIKIHERSPKGRRLMGWSSLDQNVDFDLV